MIKWNGSRGAFWIRVFGVGFLVINRAIYPPPFSVREGLRMSTLFHGVSGRFSF